MTNGLDMNPLLFAFLMKDETSSWYIKCQIVAYEPEQLRWWSWMYYDDLALSEGPEEGLKIRGGARSNVVGIVCSPGWDRVNWSRETRPGGGGFVWPLFPPVPTSLLYVVCSKGWTSLSRDFDIPEIVRNSQAQLCTLSSIKENSIISV